MGLKVCIDGICRAHGFRLKERVDRFKVRSLGAGGIAAVKGQLGHILVQRHVTDVVIIIRDVQAVMIHLHKALPQHFGDRFAGQLYDTNFIFFLFLLHIFPPLSAAHESRQEAPA